MLKDIACENGVNTLVFNKGHVARGSQVDLDALIGILFGIRIQIQGDLFVRVNAIDELAVAGPNVENNPIGGNIALKNSGAEHLEHGSSKLNLGAESSVIDFLQLAHNPSSVRFFPRKKNRLELVWQEKLC
jgi:hypothetical protein